MTDQYRSPEDIERDIERDRARLTDNLSTLQDQFSVDGLINSATSQIRTHGSDIGRELSRTVKENPAAVALTGIGLAWLIFGNNKAAKDAARFESYRDPAVYRRHNTPVSRPTPAMVGDNIDMPAWARDESEPGYADMAKDRLEDAKESLKDARDTTHNKLAQLHDDANSEAAYVRSKLNGQLDSAGQQAQHLKEAAQQKFERLKQQFSQGTEGLSETARQRVIEARYAAYDARAKAKAQLRQTGETAVDLYDRQPLIAGALAAAVGAAIAGALPRTGAEDKHLGEYSDTLMERAERIYAEERAKAYEVAQAAKDEVKQAATSAKADLQADASNKIDTVADRAKEAVSNAKETATEKAKANSLANPQH